MIIKKVKAKKIRNSRGEDTIKVSVRCDKGKGEASAPSGASKGKHEAKDFVLDVKDCVKYINKEERLKGLEINSYDDLVKVEKIINKNNVGANPTIALEYAILKCFGQIWKIIDPEIKVIPRPLGNVIGGGAHIKDGNFCEFQEFLLYPINSKNFDEAARANGLAHKLVKERLKELKVELKMTDEGAWAPENLTIQEILELLKDIIVKVYDETEITLKIGIDIAASSFWDGRNYVYRDNKLNRQEQIDYISSLIEKYDLHYVEDPLHENDFMGFAELTKKFGDKCMIVGDDLTVTNLDRLKDAVKFKAINGMIVKPNQNGSLIDTKIAIEYAKKHNLYLIASHRSGETLDPSISHIAVGFRLPILKVGIEGKERKAKLSEVVKIEKQIKYRI